MSFELFCGCPGNGLNRDGVVSATAERNQVYKEFLKWQKKK